ncbi:MAG: endonuclease III domain-containing protein, partial [Anaerolineales bacterium]
SGRMGLRPARMGAKEAHAFLEALFPAETYYAIHLNLIRLGREVCQARRPQCERCPVREWCDYAPSRDPFPSSRDAAP